MLIQSQLALRCISLRTNFGALTHLNFLFLRDEDDKKTQIKETQLVCPLMRDLQVLAAMIVSPFTSFGKETREKSNSKNNGSRVWAILFLEQLS